MTSLQGKTITGSSGDRKGDCITCRSRWREYHCRSKNGKASSGFTRNNFSAVEDIEAAGGNGLACVVDVREEKVVEEAVEKAVEHFGGIDILINNASAISLTGTLKTTMKRYDLMHQVNVRGTYLTSQKCLPHLFKAENPHILNLSPPLNLDPIWFQGYCAYTMTKYGMSMVFLVWLQHSRSRSCRKCIMASDDDCYRSD